MAYIVELKIQASRREFDTTEARDTAYDTALAIILNWGIPPENIVLTKIDTQYSDFLGRGIEKPIETYIPPEEG